MAHGFEDDKTKVDITELLTTTISEMQAQITDMKNNYWKTIYPVGSIFMSVSQTNPRSLFGGGTWVAWGSGRVPVGVNAADSSFNTVEKTGGEKAHTLTVNEMPSHTHGVSYINHEFGGSGAYTAGLNGPNVWQSNAAGGNVAHNNLQPYITCYMWKRTA